jgi:diketogulonate reductase-like aldo/keto reductase
MISRKKTAVAHCLKKESIDLLFLHWPEKKGFRDDRQEIGDITKTSGLR